MYSLVSYFYFFSQLLLERGGDINAQSSVICNFTPLHFAAHLGQRECCQVLIDNNADVNIADDEGNTSMHHAAYCNKVETVKVLVKSDDVNIRIKVLPLVGVQAINQL